MSSLIRYALFLRGINVGGNKKVPMKDLSAMMEKLGYKNVKTLLASGNALFDAETSDVAKIKKNLEDSFEKKFGFTSHMILRRIDELQALAKTSPFKGISVTKDTRLYVTFLSEKPKSAMKIPYTSDDGNFRILRKSESELCSVLIVTPDRGSVDAMAVIEKEFGKNVTTRNWNTVEKLLK